MYQKRHTIRKEAKTKNLHLKLEEHTAEHGLIENVTTKPYMHRNKQIIIYFIVLFFKA